VSVGPRPGINLIKLGGVLMNGWVDGWMDGERMNDSWMKGVFGQMLKQMMNG